MVSVEKLALEASRFAVVARPVRVYAGRWPDMPPLTGGSWVCAGSTSV